MRIIIGENDTLLRLGLASLLGGAGFDVVGLGADAPGVLALVACWQPDLLITEVRLPPGNGDDGLRAAMQIRADHPGVAVVVLSHDVQPDHVRSLLGGDNRGLGYLLKPRVTDGEQFCAHLRTVAAGGTVVDPEVLVAMVGRPVEPDPGIGRLTERQREVLALVAKGRSNAAIATRLTISERAVVQHTSKIYRQLGLWDDENDHRRVLAALRYLAL